jgi:hypothetical protein
MFHPTPHKNSAMVFWSVVRSLWRKIQQLGLVPLYNNDDDFRLSCGMMEGFAFLPLPDLTNGIHLLRTLCPDDPPEADEILGCVLFKQSDISIGGWDCAGVLRLFLRLHAIKKGGQVCNTN